MPRRDLYHETVRNALIKEGWTITHDPLILGDLELRVYPDLGAEKSGASQSCKFTTLLRIIRASE